MSMVTTSYAASEYIMTKEIPIALAAVTNGLSATLPEPSVVVAS